MIWDSAFGIPSHVVARRVGDETVILDLEAGAYFGLDPVGARIWQLLEDGRTLAGIRDMMLEEYDVAEEILERDILELARNLVARKLVCQRI